MLTVQNVKDSYTRFKRDISDVGNTRFIEWVQFTTRFIYEEVKGVDPERFAKDVSYAVVVPPEAFDLPSDFGNMRQTATGVYKYDARKRLIATFDETGDTDITFTDASATSAYNDAIKVQGGSSRGYTGDAADTMKLTFGTALDWTDFDDGGADSPTNDFISQYVYIGNSIPTSVTVGMYSTSAKTNGWTYQETSLAAGWNRIKQAKSAFTEVGTGDWESIGYIELTHAGGAAHTNVYWDKLQLVESQVNGKGETNMKISKSGYGVKKEGYYLKTGKEIVFTDAFERSDNDYVMRYMPAPPTIDELADYLTVDASATGEEILEDRHLKYMIEAIDVLYEGWDVNPTGESIADFRFTRALGGLLETYNRTPQISVIENPINDF